MSESWQKMSMTWEHNHLMGYETAERPGLAGFDAQPMMSGLAKLQTGPGHMALIRRPLPVSGDGQVVVSVHGAGVCGTDLHIAAGEYAVSPGVILGHELCGVVTGTGAGVSQDWIGRTVVAETFFSTCRGCQHCREGSPNLCLERRSIGTHVDGAFASHVLLPATSLHAVPAGVHDAAATLAEPLACVCQCLLDPSAVVPGDRVLVTGPGAIGLLAAQVARLCGGDVVVRGLPGDAARLLVARQLELGIEMGDADAGLVDVAIECSGSPAAARACLDRVRSGGKLVQIGIFGAPLELPFDDVVTREIGIRAGFASTPRSWRRATALLSHPGMGLAPLVTRVLPLGAWHEAFERADPGDLKIILDPRLPDETNSK